MSRQSAVGDVLHVNRDLPAIVAGKTWRHGSLMVTEVWSATWSRLRRAWSRPAARPPANGRLSQLRKANSDVVRQPREIEQECRAGQCNGRAVRRFHPGTRAGRVR